MFTTSDVIRAYLDDEQAVLECKTDSNRTKKAQRDRLVVQMLRTLPEKMGLACSGTAIDPAKLNAGLLAEMVLAYHYNGKPTASVLAPSGGLLDLVTAEGEEVEIKLSINGVCYNTPVARPSRVWLINRDGVYDLPAEAVAEMTATKKVLPQTHKAVTAFRGVVRMTALSLALGFAEV